MKRPIKFRAFCSATKQMINPYCELKPSGRFWGEDMTNTPYDVKADDVMQFTGLTDKNGREIYEGDVVFMNYNHIGRIIVRFIEGKFNISGYMLSKAEIIGNIHENPELLTA